MSDKPLAISSADSRAGAERGSIESDQYLQFIEAVAEANQRAEVIVAAYPSLDRSTIVHTLLNLKLSPEERLFKSLLRGGARAIFS